MHVSIILSKQKKTHRGLVRRLQMADVIIKVVFGGHEMGLTKLRADPPPLTSSVLAVLVKQYGDGTLTDSEDYTILPDQVSELEAGTYTFTTSIPQGEIPIGLVAHRATACVLTHALTGALLLVQCGGPFMCSMAAAARGLLAAIIPPGASTPARGCTSWLTIEAVF